MLHSWNELTREELRKILPGAVVVVPTGATEQHGPHLATGHDTFSVTTIAQQAAEAASSTVVVTPALPFGSSHHHLAFGGTLSLSTDTYYRVVTDLVTSIIAGGGRRILLLNGHGGNQELNVLVARDIAMQQAPDAPVAIAAASYWQIADASLQAVAGPEGMLSPGHAGAFETSTMLATNPQHVRQPLEVRADGPGKVPGLAGVRLELTGSWQTFDGYTDEPHLATAELGSALLEVIVRDVAAAVDALAGQQLPGAQ